MPTVENQAITVPASSVASRTISSFAVGNNLNRLLLAGLASYSPSAPHETHDSIVFNTSESFVKVADVITGSDPNGDYRLTLWRLIAPSVATADIVGTCSAVVGSLAMLAISIYDVHQTTPLGTAVTATATTGEPSVTFDSALGELGINLSLSEYGVSSHGGSQTEIVLDNTGWGFTATRKDGAAPNITMTEVLTGTTASWETIGVSIKPAVIDQSVGININILRPRIFAPGLAR
ncbi:MAG: hypothetical protein AB1428_13165 [Bacteroidota bacterium]